MIDTEYYAPTIQVITGIIGLLGLWIILAPSVLPQAVFSSTHIVVGGAIVIIAGAYLVHLHRQPNARLASMWFFIVLGVLLLSGALLTQSRSTLFFWSTVISSTLIIILASIPLIWGSRFGAGKGEETTIFRK